MGNEIKTYGDLLRAMSDEELAAEFTAAAIKVATSALRPLVGAIPDGIVADTRSELFREFLGIMKTPLQDGQRKMW